MHAHALTPPTRVGSKVLTVKLPVRVPVEDAFQFFEAIATVRLWLGQAALLLHPYDWHLYRDEVLLSMAKVIDRESDTYLHSLKDTMLSYEAIINAPIGHISLRPPAAGDADIEPGERHDLKLPAEMLTQQQICYEVVMLAPMPVVYVNRRPIDIAAGFLITDDHRTSYSVRHRRMEALGLRPVWPEMATSFAFNRNNSRRFPLAVMYEPVPDAHTSYLHEVWDTMVLQALADGHSQYGYALSLTPPDPLSVYPESSLTELLKTVKQAAVLAAGFEPGEKVVLTLEELLQHPVEDSFVSTLRGLASQVMKNKSAFTVGDALSFVRVEMPSEDRVVLVASNNVYKTGSLKSILYAPNNRGTVTLSADFSGTSLSPIIGYQATSVSTSASNQLIIGNMPT